MTHDEIVTKTDSVIAKRTSLNPVENYIRIEQKSADGSWQGYNGRRYTLLEMGQASLDLIEVAKENPDTEFRLVNVVVSLLATANKKEA